MRMNEVNFGLIGKRVLITDGAYKGKGYILSKIEVEANNHPKRIAAGEPEKVIVAKGVRVKLSNPVFFATGYGPQHTEWFEDEADFTARVSDGKGSLQYVELEEQER